MAEIARGDNYSIEEDELCVRVRIWRRPDRDWSDGARGASDLSEALGLLLQSLPRQRRRVLIDLRDAPPVAGPRSVAIFGAMLEDAERRGVKFAIVPATDPVQLLQARRLVATHSPTRGRVVVEHGEAEAWLRDSGA